MDEVERFRRLARSSPWLWSSVRFTHVDEPHEPVRAWVRRPQAIRVETLDGRLLLADPGRPSPTHVSMVATGDGGPGAGEHRSPTPVWWTGPTAEVPARDTDGLVAAPVRLPPWVVVDDPMWQNYRWVAMLSPRELADTLEGEPALDVDDAAEAARHGRPTLWATVRPRDGYDPRCSCCPLLPCRQAVLAEGVGDPDGEFAEAHRVALDLATGICVEAREIGGPTPGRGLDMVIEQVDQPMPEEWFTSPRRREFGRLRRLLDRMSVKSARPGLAPGESEPFRAGPTPWPPGA